MRIKPAIGLVVGPANDTHWGQVLSSPASYAIVEIEDATRHAQETGVGALSRLGELLGRQPVSLREIEEIADRVVHAPVRTLIILVPIGNVAYVVVRGKGSVYIKRGSELASLMHEDGAVSGEVKIGDTILLASNGFSSVLTREELTGLFDHLPPADIAEKLTLMLHEKSGGEGSVAFVFGVESIVENEPVVPFSPVEEGKENGEDEEAERPQKKHAIPAGLQHLMNRIRQLGSGKTIADAITRARHHPKIAIAVLTAFFLVLFSISVYLGIRKQTAAKKNVQLTAAISDAQHALDEGAALLELNPVKGRERLEQGKTILEPLLQTVSDRTIDGRQVKLLYGKITDNLTLAMHVTNIPLTLFYDMSLLKKGAVASYISRNGTTVYISDKATNTVYSMDIATKNAHVLGGGDAIKHVSYITSHGDNAYVLSDEGIYELKPDIKKPALVVKKDDQWTQISSLVSFGGNLYLLDTVKSRIWKYVALEKGFSETREYLNPDTLPDLTRATGMSIDGSVYLGTATGTILRFTQGKENTYVSKGVEPAFGAALTVYTGDDTKNIYVLDPKNSRVVVLDKEGVYVAQYVYSGGPQPTDLAVFEEQKKMILLADGKLYTIDLK